MNEIKKVLICGVGAVGSIYANIIHQYDKDNLRVLVDKSRYDKYVKSPKIFNGQKLLLDYVLPENNDYKADLILIATKFDALNEVIKNIENFVKEDTIILSLLNGVTSEELLAQKYGWKHIPLAYFIGHSAMRKGDNIVHDGIGCIVFGAKDSNTDLDDIEILKKYFDKIGIQYKIPKDMWRDLWLKYMMNIATNQPSAIFKMNFGQMQSNEKFINFMLKIMNEVKEIAKAQGVNNTETMIDEAFAGFNSMLPEGRTSMLQDVEACRKTEVEMFAGHIIELGKKYNIPTPYNIVLKDMIDVIQENYS